MVWKKSLLFIPYSSFLFKVVPEDGVENNSFKCSLCEGICQLSGRCSFFLFLMRHSFLNILSLLFPPFSGSSSPFCSLFQSSEDRFKECVMLFSFPWKQGYAKSGGLVLMGSSLTLIITLSRIFSINLVTFVSWN